MCDGMGWFSPTDYKRMLLLYDRIYYLVPSETASFRDIDGATRFMVIPKAINRVGFEFSSYKPDPSISELMLQSANADAARPSFQSLIAQIPESERLYTWRIATADADLGQGKALDLLPEQQALAHGLLLNKFLIAADSLGAIPITGKAYIHGLLADKYTAATAGALRGQPQFRHAQDLKLSPAAASIINALVPDSDLDRRSEQDILAYKDKNRKMFEAFSYAVRKLVKQIAAMPSSSDFHDQVSELINTEVWHEKTEIEEALRSAWSAFFKNAIKSSVAGAVSLGIAPLLSLKDLSMAGLLTGAATLAPWMTAELIGFLGERKKARSHGLYYLMNFAR